MVCPELIKTNTMKHLHLLLTLTVNLFCFNLEAQNDTAYFDDGSMVIGKGGIKVSIEDGNIVIDGSGINNGFKPGTYITGPSPGNIEIDGSGITDFVPVDTITRMVPGKCDLPIVELSPGVFADCGVYHEPEEVRFVILKNDAGATKEEKLIEPKKNQQ